MNILLIEDCTLCQARFFGNWHLYKTDIETREDAEIFAKAMFNADNDGSNGWDDAIPEHGWNVEVIDCCDYHETDDDEEVREKICEQNGWYDAETDRYTHSVNPEDVVKYLGHHYDVCFDESALKPMDITFEKEGENV